MSSGFVLAGSTEDAPIEKTGETNDEWEKAKQEIESARRRRHEGLQEGGKTLFDVLQQNKAAKQEAFEESIRLKNQFRSLDEDEVEFLDSVLESTRAQEDAVKKETTERLDEFRKLQEEADKTRIKDDSADPVEASGSPDVEEEQWATSGKKRRRTREKDALRGVKLRKSSSTLEKPALQEGTQDSSVKGAGGDRRPGAGTGITASQSAPESSTLQAITRSAVSSDPAKAGSGEPSKPQKPAAGLLGLDYDSDEESP